MEISHNELGGCQRVRWLFRCLATGLAAAETYVARNSILPDSTSYLDLARAYLRHDWAMTINAYWSPLYAWLLALTLGLTEPSLRWVYPVAHAMNALVFLGCLAAFEFFWTGMLDHSEYRFAGGESRPLTPRTLWILGYSLFIWMTIGTMISVVNPDLCVAAIVWLIAGIVIRLRAARDDAWPSRIGFGLALGLGYLAKAVMFPAGFIFVLASVPEWHRWKSWWRAGVVVLVFLSVAAPQIILLSRVKGRPTFSDTGKLAYAWYNYDLPLRNWQGDEPGSGKPLHPTRKVHDAPAVFEFNGPIRGSYPPWQDPSYWNDGMRPGFEVGKIAKHTEQRLELSLALLWLPKSWFIGIVLILVAADIRATGNELASYWYLLLPGAALLGMYALTFIAYRYLPPWLMLLWAAVLFAVRTRGRFAETTVYRRLPGLIAIALIAAIAYGAYGQSRDGREDDATPDYATAEGLGKLGLPPGTRVGAIGFDFDVHWAYLGGYSVVAEIESTEECAFWAASPAVRSDVLRAFAGAGAAVIVANAGGAAHSTSGTASIALKNCARPDDGWRPLEGSPNLVYIQQ
ncbi:MAG: hypothetical protein ACLPLR_07100 [Terriglobales bacterium]